MCTVTIVPHDAGFRLVCNRDERRDRPAAAAPVLHARQRGTALYPVDPQGGGTWVGVNDAGLGAALLNRTLDPAAPRPRFPLSRGGIVPHVLGRDSVREAIDAVRALDPTGFPPFRLVVVQWQRLGVLTSDGRRLSLETTNLAAPVMLTSSSLGDARVDPPRRDLFGRLMAVPRGLWLRAQDDFHRHRWPERPDLSVCMVRADAQTVSRTVIDVRPAVICVRYRPLSACGSPLATAA
jgi:hypothetical protein